MKKQSSLLIIIFLLIILISGCKGKQDEIHIVPHHLNQKVYSYETNIDLAFVTTYEIKTIENVSLSFNEKSTGDIDGIDVKNYYMFETYKGYDVFRLTLILFNIQGDIFIDSIKFDLNETSHTFDTDIRIQSESKKDVHFFAGPDGGDVFVPGFTSLGYSQTLKSNSEVKITDIYFEGTGNFDLNQYIENIYVDDKILEEERTMYKGDLFYLEIIPNSLLPKNIMIMDQIIIKYKDANGKVDFGYVLVPLVLYSIIACSQNYIDFILEKGS